MLRTGADDELDEQRRLRDGGREALAAIETRERARTEIPSLKVQHNRVFGYFLEVPKAHLAKVPQEYVRKQTLANAERYVTEELAKLESKVLGAQALARAREQEQELFEALRGRVSQHGERLCDVGERVAALDVLAGLAEVAQREGLCRPEGAGGPARRAPSPRPQAGSADFGATRGESAGWGVATAVALFAVLGRDHIRVSAQRA